MVKVIIQQFIDNAKNLEYYNLSEQYYLQKMAFFKSFCLSNAELYTDNFNLVAKLLFKQVN
jgi:hypothetical protein